MQFESPEWLLLLIVVPLLHRFWKRRMTPPSVTLSYELPEKIRTKNPLNWRLLLRYIGLAFIIVALARPQSAYQQSQRTVDGVDIVMVMDVSASMRAVDLADRSRLDVAKETMKNFVKGRTNDRIGFVVFSGEPVTLAPPTLDYGLLLREIDASRIGQLKDGTAIGDGLALAVSRLRDSKAKSRIIILLTDGDNNVGQLDPGTAGELAAGFGIRTYTIAIGREGRVKIPIQYKNVFGNVVTKYQWQENALNTQLLEEIARITSAKFYRVTDEETLKKVFKEIDQLEKTEIKAADNVRYRDMFSNPLKFGLIFLMLEQILALAWWRFLF